MSNFEMNKDKYLQNRYIKTEKIRKMNFDSHIHLNRHKL